MNRPKQWWQTVVAGISENTLQAIGGSAFLLASSVIVVSLTTEYGLAVRGVHTTTVSASHPLLTAELLIAFVQAHPAYLVAILAGVYVLFRD